MRKITRKKRFKKLNVYFVIDDSKHIIVYDCHSIKWFGLVVTWKRKK